MTGPSRPTLPPDLVAGARRFAEDRRTQLVELCGTLAAAGSAQPEGDTRAAATVLADFLSGEGLAPTLRAAVPGKPNVVRTTGTGGRHLILNGHLDTLPLGDARAWTVPPFAMGREDGRPTGLGIGNMKAGTAALAMAFAFLSRRPELGHGRATFTAVADEVVFGPHGTAWLLETDGDLSGDAVLNGEGPGDLNVAVAEKGLLWVELRVTASPGQGMLATRGSSAVARLAALIAAVDGWNDHRADVLPAIAPVAAHAGADGLRVSVNVGRIEGGHFVSQVATEARAEVDFRLPPGLTIADVSARLDALVAGQPSASWRLVKGWDPNWTPLDSPIVASVLAAGEAVRGACVPVVRLPASDAARWRARGVPAVCFGPQPTPAVGVDDYVDEQSVVDCVAVYGVAALAYLGGAR